MPIPDWVKETKNMRIATQSRFAIIALLDLAIHSKNEFPVSLVSIARRQRISLSYIEQLFARLRTEGLVISYRGPGGGYLLAKPAEKISISQIVNAVDRSKSYRIERVQAIHGLWVDLEKQMMSYLDDIYLSSLIEQADPAMLAAAPETHSVKEVAQKLGTSSVGLLKEPKPIQKQALLPNSVFDWGRYLTSSKVRPQSS